MADASDFSGLIGPVADILLGPANPRLSNKNERRYGTNGSLAVDLTKDTYYDFESEEGGGVLDLIAKQTGRKANGPAADWLKEQGLIDGARDRQPDRPPPARGKMQIAAEYDYTDENGDLVFQVVRFVPKDFRQRRPATPNDPPDKVKDGWVWSVKGVKLVPYRLPDLTEAIALGKTVYIVEGERDADNGWRHGLPSTSAPMGAGKWSQDLVPYFAGADVVVIADNDPQARMKDGTLRFHDNGEPVYTGQDHAETIARALVSAAERVRIVFLGGEPQPPEAGPLLNAKGDLTDFFEAGNGADELRAFVEKHGRAPGTKSERLHFGAVWFADSDRGLEEPEWLVDDLLTVGDMSLVYGPSKSGKSFLATHLSMAIARGVDAFERKVRRGGVVYVAAEGRRGFKKRLKAYRIENGIKAGTELPFLLIPSPVDFFATAGDIDALIADLKLVAPAMERLGVGIDLCVVDTYAAVSPGANENASEDVSKIIRNCHRIREVAPNVHVMIVHHKNAAGDRPRGHSSLYASIDNAIEVSCDKARNRTARIDKMKDGEDGFSIGFRLQSVTIGARDDGKPITSCVVVPAQVQERTGKGPRLSDEQFIALQALREALATHGEPAPSSLQLPHGMRLVRAEHWKRELLKRGFYDDLAEGAFRTAFHRVGKALMSRGTIGRDQPYVWIVREPSS